MNAIRSLLADRRRRQRGSVLSAVLIMVAFLAIITGALMTELSTNFLLSNDLVNRVNTEATVNSAMEVALSQLQAASLNSPCPALNPVPLNGQTAVATILSCFPVIDAHSPQSFTTIANSNQFSLDGTHAQVPGLNDYVIGDLGGTVFDFRYGQSFPRWTLGLGGSITGPPAVMSNPTNGHFLDLIPVSGPACGAAAFCLSVRSDSGLYATPGLQCTAATSAPVSSQPAGGRNFTAVAFFGDASSSGNLYAIDPTSGGTCESEGLQSTGNPIVAGPVVFRCSSGCGGKNPDEVFTLSSTNGSSQLNRFTYTTGTSLVPAGSLSLPWGMASGIAVENTTLPSRLAISFAGGVIALVQIDASANMGVAASVGLPAGVNRAPFWCHCPGSLDLIGVGGSNGSLYILDTGLSTYATYSSGHAIRTVPAANGAGDWYFAADDGQVYEVQMPPSGTAMSLAATFGAASEPITSSPLLGSCPAGICIYLGSTDGHAYLVPIDARDAVLTACISTSPPGCSGANPRLWTHVQVGVAGNNQMVHVQGWSYYSP